MSEEGTIDNVEALLDAGEALAGAEARIASVEHDGVGIPVCVNEDSEGNRTIAVMNDVIAASDELQPGPKRREGMVTLTEVDSFTSYVERFATEHAIVYANVSAFSFVAILDEHPPGKEVKATAWRKHRASYSCPRSPEWIAWTASDGASLPQEKFADFIESRLEDLTTGEGYPAPTDVLTMARNLMVRTKGTFERVINPTTGTGTLVCKNENDAGSTEIPRAFLVGIPVFEGGERYRVEARVRFELREGRAMFSYTLHRRKEIERDAFDGLRKHVASETGKPVLAGSP